MGQESGGTDGGRLAAEQHGCPCARTCPPIHPPTPTHCRQSPTHPPAHPYCRSVRGLTLRLADRELTPPAQGRQAIAIALPLLLEKGAPTLYLRSPLCLCSSSCCHCLPLFDGMQCMPSHGTSHAGVPQLRWFPPVVRHLILRPWSVCLQACPPRCRRCKPWPSTPPASWRPLPAPSCCARTWQPWCLPCWRASGKRQ